MKNIPRAVLKPDGGAADIQAELYNNDLSSSVTDVFTAFIKLVNTGREEYEFFKIFEACFSAPVFCYSVHGSSIILAEAIIAPCFFPTHQCRKHRMYPCCLGLLHKLLQPLTQMALPKPIMMPYANLLSMERSHQLIFRARRRLISCNQQANPHLWGLLLLGRLFTHHTNRRTKSTTAIVDMASLSTDDPISSSSRMFIPTSFVCHVMSFIMLNLHPFVSNVINLVTGAMVMMKMAPLCMVSVQRHAKHWWRKCMKSSLESKQQSFWSWKSHQWIGWCTQVWHGAPTCWCERTSLNNLVNFVHSLGSVVDDGAPYSDMGLVSY